MNKKIAGIPKDPDQAHADFTTKNDAGNLYCLLRSGSLVSVNYPADLIVIGRFLTLYEPGSDARTTEEAAVSVSDLLRHGRVMVEVLR